MLKLVIREIVSLLSRLEKKRRRYLGINKKQPVCLDNAKNRRKPWLLLGEQRRGRS